MANNYRSRRARILVNLQRQLDTILKTNGYATDVFKVTTHVQSWSATPAAECPVIYIVDEKTRYVYGPTKTIEKEWDIGLFGVMKDRTQLEMEELVADIEECLFKNVTLAFDGERGVVSHMRITDIQTDAQLFSEIEGSQLFKMSIVLRYTGCVDNPR